MRRQKTPALTTKYKSVSFYKIQRGDYIIRVCSNHILLPDRETR